MIKTSLHQLMQATDFVFVVEVIALTIALGVVGLLLALGIMPIVRKVWGDRCEIEQQESTAIFAHWAIGHFAKLTTIQVVWSTGAYVAFCLLNVPRVQGRLFIVLANVICSVSVFLDSIREPLVRRKRKNKGRKG